MNRASLLYWWPLVRSIGVPIPRTEIVRIKSELFYSILDREQFPERIERQLLTAADKIGFPLFIRNDIMSGKHEWQDTCFVPAKEELFKHIWALTDRHFCAFGVPDPQAIVFRELLVLESTFTAFRGLPIAKERRYFIRDGEVECHHPYWPEGAILSPSTHNWVTQLELLNREDEDEIAILTQLSLEVAKQLLGFWSVDFAKTDEGCWFLIDMAPGEQSYHSEHFDDSSGKL